MEIFIETPKGSRIKYAWDKTSGTCRAKKLLSAGLTFPYDFGFIPGTTGEDGDPLDVFVIAEFSTYPGITIDARIIGCIEVRQSASGRMIRNDRFLAVPGISREFETVKDIGMLPPRFEKEINAFMKAYMEAEGKTIQIEGLINAAAALKKLGR